MSLNRIKLAANRGTSERWLYFYSTIREVLISVGRSLSSINILRNLWLKVRGNFPREIDSPFTIRPSSIMVQQKSKDCRVSRAVLRDFG